MPISMEHLAFVILVLMIILLIHLLEFRATLLWDGKLYTQER